MSLSHRNLESQLRFLTQSLLPLNLEYYETLNKATEPTTVSIEDYLIPGKQYRLHIYTLDQNGRRSAPLIREFEAQLGAPADVYIIDVGHENIEIGWKSGAYEYG